METVKQLRRKADLSSPTPPTAYSTGSDMTSLGLIFLICIIRLTTPTRDVYKDQKVSIKKAMGADSQQSSSGKWGRLYPHPWPCEGQNAAAMAVYMLHMLSHSSLRQEIYPNSFTASPTGVLCTWYGIPGPSAV